MMGKPCVIHGKTMHIVYVISMMGKPCICCTLSMLGKMMGNHAYSVRYIMYVISMMGKPCI